MKDALVYKTYPEAKVTMPNHYTVYDRNIQGVRMNYDLYSAAMNGRVTDQLVGKNTYVGLTLAEPPKNGKRAFSAAIYGINAFPMGANNLQGKRLCRHRPRFCLARGGLHACQTPGRTLTPGSPMEGPPILALSARPHDRPRRTHS